jgi:hypothetical protein
MRMQRSRTGNESKDGKIRFCSVATAGAGTFDIAKSDVELEQKYMESLATPFGWRSEKGYATPTTIQTEKMGESQSALMSLHHSFHFQNLFGLAILGIGWKRPCNVLDLFCPDRSQQDAALSR